VEFLGSADIGVDDHHGPRLYSRFIGGLLERVKSPPTKPPRSSRSKRKNPEFSATLHPTTLSPVSAQPPLNYFEPLPARTTTPFDHFAWPTDADPLAGGASEGSALGLTATEFFYAPLPYDSDLVESMQSLSSLSEMSDTMLPGTHAHRYRKSFSIILTRLRFFSGFGWMKQMPPVNFHQYEQQQMNGVYYS
jgi:hypothetical protein